MDRLKLNYLFNKVKGNTLTEIKALVYVSVDNHYDVKTPYKITFIFDNDEYFTFSCHSDFVSLDVNKNKIQEFDMQESGRAEIVDFSVCYPFSQIFNHSLTEVFVLYSGIEQQDIGFSLSFENIDIAILNLGCEIFYFPSLSKDFILDEKITYHKLF